MILMSNKRIIHRIIVPRPPFFWRAGQQAKTGRSAPVPRRSGNKVFTRFFCKKIAGAGQSPAAARIGPPAKGRTKPAGQCSPPVLLTVLVDDCFKFCPMSLHIRDQLALGAAAVKVLVLPLDMEINIAL